MVRMPVPEMCLHGEGAYTIDVPTRRMYLYNDMMWVRAFTTLFHIWYLVSWRERGGGGEAERTAKSGRGLQSPDFCSTKIDAAR